jgi:uncharacterized membrane protein
MCTIQQIQLQIIGTIILVLIDATYLNLNKGMYKPIMSLNKGIRIFPALLCWFVIILGIQLLVLSRNDITNWKQASLYGGMLGFVSYAIYNTTNQATIDVWNWPMAIGDTAWGTLVTATMSGILFWFRGFI